MHSGASLNQPYLDESTITINIFAYNIMSFRIRNMACTRSDNCNQEECLKGVLKLLSGI